MGARTYPPRSGFADQLPQETAGSTAMPKVMFSATLAAPSTWAGTELVGDDAVEAVRPMKVDAPRPLGALGTLGSLALCRSLLGAGLVDATGRGLPGDHRCDQP